VVWKTGNYQEAKEAKGYIVIGMTNSAIEEIKKSSEEIWSARISIPVIML
jgi:hypothetical protein